MSDVHPYWSYGPDKGQEIVEALNEGRRAAALELAVSAGLGFTAADLIAVAAQFEAYLKGDAVQDTNGAQLSG